MLRAKKVLDPKTDVKTELLERLPGFTLEEAVEGLEVLGWEESAREEYKKIAREKFVGAKVFAAAA